MSSLLGVVQQLPLNLLTPVFFGTVAASVVFGISSLQTYRYFVRYTHDTRAEKCSVGLLWLINMVHTSAALLVAYHNLVSAWNAPLELLSLDLFRALKLEITSMALIICYVYTLYGWIAWKLGCNVHQLFRYAIVIVVAAGHGICILGIIQAYHIHPDIQIITHSTSFFGPAIYLIYASATIVDVTLAVFVCAVLRKSHGEFSRTSSRLSLLNRYIVASGLLTSVIDLIILITLAALPGKLVFFAFQMVIPGLYVVSYLALLNTRKVFRHAILCTAAPNMPIWGSKLTVHVNTLTAINHSVSSDRGPEHAILEKVPRSTCPSHKDNNSADEDMHFSVVAAIEDTTQRRNSCNFN